MLQHIICLNYEQNSCIVVRCDNMFIMESRDELVFVDLFLSSNTSFVINVSCDLPKATTNILVTNVA